MKNIFEELCGLRKRDAELRELAIPLSEMLAKAREMPPPVDFVGAFAGPGIHVIAELKRASPSEGVIREDFDPVLLASELEDSGAAALSVLCEPHRFLGSERYLAEAVATVRIPVLYKDFVVTPYQIAAARLAGASAVLLIVAALDDNRLKTLIALVRELGFTALVETHDESEIARACAAGADVIGVNCRDLRTFATDVSRVERLLGKIPDGIFRIAESGIHSSADIVRLRAAGADGFLVGTALMRAERPGRRLQELLGLH